MDPAIKTYLDSLKNSLDANTAAMQAQSMKIDDLMASRPELERRVNDLAVAVSDLQRARGPGASSDAEAVAKTAPPPPTATGSDLPGADSGAAAPLLGSTDRGDFNLTRGCRRRPFGPRHHSRQTVSSTPSFPYLLSLLSLMRVSCSWYWGRHTLRLCFPNSPVRIHGCGRHCVNNISRCSPYTIRSGCPWRA